MDALDMILKYIVLPVGGFPTDITWPTKPE